MLKLRKKTTAAVAGIMIGALCLWGVAMWQDISRAEILNLLLGTLLFIGLIMVAAIVLLTVFKLLGRFIGWLTGAREKDSGQR